MPSALSIVPVLVIKIAMPPGRSRAIDRGLYPYLNIRTLPRSGFVLPPGAADEVGGRDVRFGGTAPLD